MSWVMLASSWFQSTSGRVSLSMLPVALNPVSLHNGMGNYGVEQTSCISNTWILLVLKLNLIRMSWSYLSQFVSMLPTVLPITVKLDIVIS